MLKIRVKFVDLWREHDRDPVLEQYVRRVLDGMGEVELSEQPDFVFCGSFGKDCLRYDATRIFFATENIRPDFNIYDYAITTDDIAFGDRALCLPWYLHFYYHDKVLPLFDKHTYPDEVYRAKQKFCNFVVSNYGASPLRESMFEELNAYKHVDSGGRSHNNLPDGQPVADKIAFQRDYRFSIAFENASTPGYCTEKIIDAFAAATVPIYWGAPDAGKLYNPAAFVDCTPCADVQEMVAKVRAVEENPDAWLAMMRAPVFLDEAKVRAQLEHNPMDDFVRAIVARGPAGSRRRSPDFWMRNNEEYERQAFALKKQWWWKYYAGLERRRFRQKR